MRTQIALEDEFTEVAKLADEKTRVVVLCDRGLMDGCAFMNLASGSDNNWQALLDEMGIE